MIDIQAVAARSMLCTLNLSAWRATRTHKGETEAEKKRHNSDAPRVLVTVCNHKALSELQALHCKARDEHNRMTLPSVQDGMRLLPAGRQLEHAALMSKLSDEHAGIVTRFLADYDAEAAAAPVRLNGLYDPSMWPSHGEVSGRFGYNVRYLACPTDGAWGEWLAESARAAQDELQARLTDALERVKERCGSDGRLYSTVFTNLAEVLSLVPDLDFFDSPELKAMANQAAPLAALSADTLRDDKTARAAASDAATRILAGLGGVQ